MNCPICNNKMPYGLQIHMAAAHSPDSAKRQLRAAQGMEETSPIGGKNRPQQKKRSGRPFGKKSSQRPRPPRPF